jgi:uncharacterized repeat protein (TIGR03803 family)
MTLRILVIGLFWIASLAGLAPAVSASPRVSLHNPIATTTTGYSLIYNFKGGRDGLHPVSGLTLINGSLYGTTLQGGVNGVDAEFGTLFEIENDNAERVIYSFASPPDATNPSTTPIELAGTLYGVTAEGGVHNSFPLGGAAYSITTNGKEHVIYSFGGRGNGDDPIGIIASADKFYGTTSAGGTLGSGTVFSLTPQGAEKILYSFTSPFFGTGLSLPSGPLLSMNKLFYGAARAGGQYQVGGVYSVTPTGSEKTVFSFPSQIGGCIQPGLALIDNNGTLYGVSGGGRFNFGCIYSLTPTGVAHILWNFSGTPSAGEPSSPLLYVRGKLYGTTLAGGTYGFGTLYSLSPSGTLTILHSFGSGKDGRQPQGELSYVNGAIYGTTEVGGNTVGGTANCPMNIGGCGTIYKYIL